MNRTAFFAAVRKSFGGLNQKQVDGFEWLLTKWSDWNLTDIRWLAYMMATVWHETAATMQPIAEYGKGRGHKYGKPGKHGQVAYGRGYVQLTWDYNYEKADRELHLNGALIADYDLALRPDTAAGILFQGMIEGWFTGKKLSDYINAAGADYKNARRIINGTDRAQLIAGHALKFEAALMTWTADKPVPAQKPGLVVGDSIAVGTGDQLGGFTTNAKEGIPSALILERVKPGYRYYIISAGSNDSNLGVLKANLQTIAMRTEDADARVWILPSPKNAQTAAARAIVVDLAKALGDRTVDFTPGQDGIHPLSYKAVARDVMTVIRSLEAQPMVSDQPTMSVPEDIPVIFPTLPPRPPDDPGPTEPDEPPSGGFFMAFVAFLRNIFSQRQ